MMVLSPFYFIACLKWLHLANLLIYFECLIRLVVMLIPNFVNYEYTTRDYTVSFALIFVGVYCDSSRSQFALTVTYGMNLFFDVAAYKRELTIAKTLFFIVIIFVFFLSITACSSIIVHS